MLLLSLEKSGHLDGCIFQIDFAERKPNYQKIIFNPEGF
jgi:hypothetical protein